LAGAALAGLVPAEANNIRLVGFNDLQARSAYQPTIHKQGDRYIAYIGHHGASYDAKPVNPVNGAQEFNGTSIVDVTDPGQPKYLAHIPGAEGGPDTGGAQMTRVCDGRGLPKGDANAVYLLRPFGRLAHEIWNVADPAKPQARHAHRRRLQGHAQELVGVRHRDRLSGFGRAGLARAAHARNLRPRRSVKTGEDSRLRPAGS
jgi:hypothetical protein